MSGDVLQKGPLGPALVNDAGDVGPEVAGVILAPALPGMGKRLAGVSGEDGIESASEWPCVECGEIVPDWRRGEVSGPLSCDEAGSRVFFPLDKAAGVEARLGEHETHIKATAACAEGQSVPGV